MITYSYIVYSSVMGGILYIHYDKKPRYMIEFYINPQGEILYTRIRSTVVSRSDLLYTKQKVLEMLRIEFELEDTTPRFLYYCEQGNWPSHQYVYIYKKFKHFRQYAGEALGNNYFHPAAIFLQANIERAAIQEITEGEFLLRKADFFGLLPY